jgi:sugar phosphate isomerase/epimerase
MVRESLARDYAGTLAALARLGVQQVELATIPSLAPAAFRRQLNDLGLSCTSAHMPLLAMNDDEVANALQLAAALGLRHIFAPTPGFDGIGALPLQDRMTALIRRGLTADDWRWNAQRLNQLGERAIAAGLRLGYHNHNIEFGALPDAGRPIDLLLQGTEAALVDFQIDVGNAVLGGGDPMALVAAHPTRFAAAHLKDWAPPLTVTTRASLPPASAPFGAGVIDWARWASVSAAAGITAQFIEQEGLAAQAGLEGAAQGVRFFARGS